MVISMGIPAAALSQTGVAVGLPGTAVGVGVKVCDGIAVGGIGLRVRAGKSVGGKDSPGVLVSIASTVRYTWVKSGVAVHSEVWEELHPARLIHTRDKARISRGIRRFILSNLL
jgi:hypothetical protein